ncbi:MAG: tetratricopeptide repeat protein [Candidatus Eisenbacteria bacterium]|nr:tetratricopeptide repeat protein [Candidatus Eisenbacteria bacterium]
MEPAAPAKSPWPPWTRLAPPWVCATRRRRLHDGPSTPAAVTGFGPPGGSGRRPSSRRASRRQRTRGCARPAVLLTLAVLLLLGSAGVRTSAAESRPAPWPWDEPDFARAAGRFFEHLYRLEYDSCRVIADSLARARPDDPLALIFRARILRDLIREVDVTKSTRESQFAEFTTIFGELRRRAERRLDDGSHDPRSHLALGWAGMMTAQVEVMLKEYWSANKTSKQARDHVEKVLEAYPDQPDATFLLGAYLYMTDTLPDFLKMLKWIPFLGIPSGDHDRGLDMVEESGRTTAPTAGDYKLFLGFIHVFYEGGFRESERLFYPFYKEIPANPRFTLPLALVAPFDPAEALLAERYWREMSQAWGQARSDTTASRPWWAGLDRWSVSLALRVRMTAAFQWEAMGRPDKALPMYKQMVKEPLAGYKRVEGPVRMGLARCAVLAGRIDLARTTLQSLLDDDNLDPWHDPARELRREAVKEPPDVRRRELWREMSAPLIEALESVAAPGRARETQAASEAPFPAARLAEVTALHDRAGGSDPMLTKLAGDAYLLAGRFQEARQIYDRIDAGDLPPSLWPLGIQIRLNRAYILEQQDRPGDAAEEIEDALDMVVDPDLIRYTLESRRHGLKRAADR